MTVMTARSLAKQGHDVVIIEVEKEKIDRLSDDMDCSFVYGDASKPNILTQVNPKDCDFLFCLTNSDQTNIITALLGRSMGFKRVVPSIEDVELQQLCVELGLDDTIIPVHTMTQYLINMVEGLDIFELSTVLKNDARLFTFYADRTEANKISDLNLPDDAKVIFYYRGEKFYFATEDTRFKKDDEIVILTHRKNLPDLNDRWNPKHAGKNETD